MKTSFKLTGIKELDNVLKGMPLQFTHRVLQQTNADAGKILVNKAKLLAPEGPTGKTIDSIGVVKPSFKAADGVGEVHVGPRRGRFKGHAAHLIEYGTRERNYNGANRGVMPATPFMEPAFEATKDDLFKDIETRLARKLLAFMRRTIRG